ncbi:CC_3452 family protein [Aurantiacibacter poecillastricola]|uniref:CC_3452 family protein n=1 Tax=Aurantiacibacter poecillastricola TaxID=3064385 RepID=UPI00273F6589|nr:hypothetical protein [Aurantiacibacter sp. 219JJ12-13]MDP5261015.1 hypothetical protein [Aurantiacibacter sp. 219JJ12-13]
MNRFTSLARLTGAAFAASVSPLGAQAQGAAPWFSVQLAAEASETRVIAGGVMFSCEGTTCTGPRSNHRALRVCSELRRKAGPVTSFTANGSPLPEEQLARCNG